MTIFERIEAAKLQVKAEAKDVELELDDSEWGAFMRTGDEVPGAAGVAINQGPNSPLRVILKHGEDSVFISV